jgi:hypothetical protein
MLSLETLLELIARVERAMRPLSTTSAGPDHERVSELYTDLVGAPDSTDDPLEQARLEVLYDILHQYLPPAEPALVYDTDTAVYDIQTAIGALIMCLCRLDDEDYEAALASLDTARHLLQDTQDLFSAFRGGMAQA